MNLPFAVAEEWKSCSCRRNCSCSHYYVEELANLRKAEGLPALAHILILQLLVKPRPSFSLCLKGRGQHFTKCGRQGLPSSELWTTSRCCGRLVSPWILEVHLKDNLNDNLKHANCCIALPYLTKIW